MINRKLILAILLLTAGGTGTVTAAPAWYHGKVTRIAILSGNDFILTMSGNALSDCQYEYVYFREATLGADKIKNAYAMALTAFVGEKVIGVVIDKAINGPGGTCDQVNNMFDITP